MAAPSGLRRGSPVAAPSGRDRTGRDRTGQDRIGWLFQVIVVSIIVVSIIVVAISSCFNMYLLSYFYLSISICIYIDIYR